VTAAIDALARILAVPRALVARQLTGWRTHDWSRDRFSRGAYAYVGVGGMHAPAALARPVAGTLFFAGEATDAEQMGTVGGAIRSGLRAAGEVLEARATWR
jgi:monoamine oxidase